MARRVARLCPDLEAARYATALPRVRPGAAAHRHLFVSRCVSPPVRRMDGERLDAPSGGRPAVSRRARRPCRRPPALRAMPQDSDTHIASLGGACRPRVPLSIGVVAGSGMQPPHACARTPMSDMACPPPLSGRPSGVWSREKKRVLRPDERSDVSSALVWEAGRAGRARAGRRRQMGEEKALV